MSPVGMEHFKDVSIKPQDVKNTPDSFLSQFDQFDKPMDVKETAPAERLDSPADPLDTRMPRQEVKEGDFYSSYNERLSRCPADPCETGHWEGDRGESKFISDDAEAKQALKPYHMDGVEYDNCIPDFSKCSEATVQIDHMTEYRQTTTPEQGGPSVEGNYEQADAKCAELWTKENRDGRAWTAKDVKDWRTANHYTWHECNDRKTCQLIPEKVNEKFRHLGGCSECKKRDSGNIGGEFDEQKTSSMGQTV